MDGGDQVPKYRTVSMYNEITIIGKGPSASKAVKRGFTIAINSAFHAIPFRADCLAFVDGCWRQNAIANMHRFEKILCPRRWLVVFKDKCLPFYRERTPILKKFDDGHPTMPGYYTATNTLCYAVEILKAKKVHLYGLDGGYGYAKSLPMDNHRKDGYDKVKKELNHHILRLCCQAEIIDYSLKGFENG